MQLTLNDPRMVTKKRITETKLHNLIVEIYSGLASSKLTSIVQRQARFH